MKSQRSLTTRAAAVPPSYILRLQISLWRNPLQPLRLEHHGSFWRSQELDQRFRRVCLFRAAPDTGGQHNVVLQVSRQQADDIHTANGLKFGSDRKSEFGLAIGYRLGNTAGG